MPVRRKYDVFGPFEIPRIKNGRRVDRDRRKNFWDELEEKNEGLAFASGCYIFGIRAGQGAKPWYIGKATKTFKQECFTDHKLVKYNQVLDQMKGTPILFLLARRTPTGKFAKNLGAKESEWVERELIHRCLDANDSLLNKRDTAFYQEVIIPGLINNPRARPSLEVQKLLNLLKPK